MKRFLNRRSLILSSILIGGLWLAYWYLPFHFVASNPRIDSLIEKLASTNAPPEFPGEPAHFFFDDFLKDPGDWKAEAQKPVSAAYYELKSIGKDAFPYLIKHFGDNRYSHERCSATFTSHSVGETCRFLIDAQVDRQGMGYKSRRTPDGAVGFESDFRSYVQSNYGSYAAWWKVNSTLSLQEMRIDYCEWRISKENAIGFVSESQKSEMQKSFDEMLTKARQKSDDMPLPAPDEYSVDAIIQDIKRRESYAAGSSTE